MSTIETRAALPTGTWAADSAHSRVEFAVEYMVGTFRGSFTPFAATLTVDESGEGTLIGTTAVEAVRVQDENLEAHLASPDFFDAERAPELRFASREIVRDGDEVRVDGDLTVKGQTRPVTLTGTVTDVMEDPWGQDRIGLTLSGTVDRTDFGLTWNNPLPSGKLALGNEVAISAEIYFVRQ
jgi:polyisoprenoid-binding protein YceI